MDVEELVGQVWNLSVQPLVAEAWRDYSVGSYRSCIAMSWAAVCADLMDKVLWLADDGDGGAGTLRTRIDEARTEGVTSAGVQAMQQVERELIDVAVNLDIVDSVDARALQRLREDRHLCVHPSVRGMGEPYDPSPEYAKAHLGAALRSVLVHAPTQGRRVVERFAAYVADPTFDPSPQHLERLFYGRLRPGARAALLEVAAKHALLELGGPDGTDARVLADRMAQALSAFAQFDRGSVQVALDRVQDRFLTASGDEQLRALGRLGHLDAFWSAADLDACTRLSALVDTMKVPIPYGEIEPTVAAVLSLVAVAEGRDALPQLEGIFGRLPAHPMAAVMNRRIHPYFASYVARVLTNATSWRGAEDMTRLAVLPYAPLLDLTHLDAALAAWAENVDCRTAGGMVEYASQLHQATHHLRPNDEPLWRKFIARVREIEPPDGLYRYEELELQVNSASAASTT